MGAMLAVGNLLNAGTSKGDARLLSDVDLGDSVTQDGLNINSHIREEFLVFDSNSDGKKITLEIPDPTPPIPDYDRWCSTWDGDIVPVVVGWPYDDMRKVNLDDVTATFPLKTLDHSRLEVFNVTMKRDYSRINCVYNKTIFVNKTEVPDKTGFRCRDFVDNGYSCNDMVFVYGYDCQGTCVTPTLDKVDEIYGWYSLQDALRDHRDRVRGLIAGAKSYTISLPKETGTTILTHNGETHLKGDIYLGNSTSDRIFIPGLVDGVFTVIGSILGKEALRFKTSAETPYTLTLGIANQTADRLLTLPDESGVLLSTNSSFSTLNTLGVLTSLTANGSAYFNSNVTLGDELSDELRFRGAIMGEKLFFNASYAPYLAESIRVMTLGGSLHDDNFLHVGVEEPSGNHTITIPDESGTILTSASHYSTLRAVGALSAGSLVAGFGAAHVASLRCDGESLLLGNVSLGDSSSDVISIRGTLAGRDPLRFEGPEASANDLTLRIASLTKSRTITLPDLGGVVLTDQSNVSTLTAVGALSVGSIVSGFGDATVQKLTSSATARLTADVELGVNRSTSIEFKGRISNKELVFDENGVDGKLTLVFNDPATAHNTIYFPPQDGQVLLTTSTSSILQGVGDLKSGSIVPGFGPINTDHNIATVSGASITANGDLVAQSRTVYSNNGYPAATNLIIPSGVTIIRVTVGNANNVNGITLPGAADGVKEGQMLVVHNADNMDLVPAVAHSLSDIKPNEVATYFFLSTASGAKWVETNRHCSARGGGC